jgi:hypothetical protein
VLLADIAVEQQEELKDLYLSCTPTRKRMKSTRTRRLQEEHQKLQKRVERKK